MINKNVILDFTLLKDQNLSIEDFIYLLWLYYNKEFSFNDDNINFKRLQDLKYIKVIKDEDTLLKIVLRTSSIDIIETLLIDKDITFKNDKKIIKKSKRVINNDIENRIDEFRNKWRGLKPGSMGSLKSCKDKLSRWMTENPNYSFDEVLKAADLYLNNEGRNLRFLQRADYFIYKQENNREEASRLSAYIDDIDDNEVSDWTSKLI